MSEAVSWALTLQRQVVAARLEVDISAVEIMATKLWPNPQFTYSVNNLVLGAGNDQERELRPGFAEQTIQSFGLEQTFDVWRRRWARLQVASRAAEVARHRLADVLREVVYQTRTAFLDAAREEREYALSQANAEHWQKSVQLMTRRLSAGDISRSDLAKMELETLRARNGALAARQEYRQARAVLAAHIGLAGSDGLPAHLILPGRNTAAYDEQQLQATANNHRPDVLAAASAVAQARANITAAKREALPEITVGLSYGRSQFMISGDNPHTLGLTVAVPLPVADRNQVGRAQATIALTQARNTESLLRITVAKELTEALAALNRAQDGLVCFEGDGMLDKAESARNVAHRALERGAFSVLDVLEAERTALEVQAEYLAMQHALHQAQAQVAYVIAQESL